MLPFTPEQFVGVFAAYNDAIWPAQVVAYLAGIAALLSLFRRPARAGTAVSAILAAMWLWTGIVYHGVFFAGINPAAYLFAALFVVQGVLFAVAAVRERLQFRWTDGPGAWTGLAFIAYAAVLYPLIGLWMGDSPRNLPWFGVTPCPVTIFTFGLLLLAPPPVPAGLLLIPLLWSLVGGSAALLLDVPQDWALLASGLIAVPVIVRRNRGKGDPVATR